MVIKLSPIKPNASERESMNATAIDIGMTWKGAAQIIALALENGTGEGKRLARLELQRMAELLDLPMVQAAIANEQAMRDFITAQTE